MNDKVKILAFAGSTRTGSWNKKVIRVAAETAVKAGADVTLIDLRDYPMPLFDGDLEDREGVPENGKKFKQLLKENQGLLICTPEYNSSLPAVLKNAIDWASREETGEKPLACFENKIAGILSASPGALGGLRSLTTLRAILGNIKVMVIPEQLAVSKADEAFDDNGSLKDERRQKTIETITAKLVSVIQKMNA
jgi:chromate reductase